MSYNIGSFNLRDFNFSNVSADMHQEKLSRDFNLIAKIIVQEKFDVIALQEINSGLALKHLICYLNRYKCPWREYTGCFGEEMPNQKGRRDPERYGFIWNSKRLRLLKTYRNHNPGYYENAGAGNLIRPPYYGRFTARGMLGGCNFELRIVNTHILGPTYKGDRIQEFNILVKQILPRICDHRELSEDGEFMPAYTFLVGDYNLSLNKGEQSVYRIGTITETRYTGKRRSYKTVQNLATTLKMPKDQNLIEECYANDYDHFTYETDLDLKLILAVQRVEVLNKYFADIEQPVEKLRQYRGKVSDHVPIKLVVNFK